MVENEKLTREPMKALFGFGAIAGLMLTENLSYCKEILQRTSVDGLGNRRQYKNHSLSITVIGVWIY
jgi:hypothetical protein